MITTKNLCKTYYSKKNVATHALNNVSTEFHAGETVALLGPSGSGKTTLLNLLSGFDTADDGSEILINGISTKKFKPKNWDNYRSYKVGYIFQNECLIEHLNVLDNVCMAMAFSNFKTRLRVKLAKEAIEKVGLAGLEHKYPNELSGGQQQLVTIARAIVKDPDIILADEPTKCLDTKTSKKILDVLKRVSHDKLLIIASHNYNLVKDYASKIMYLEDGSITSVVNQNNVENADAVAGNNFSKQHPTDFPNENKTSATIILEGNKIKTRKSRLPFSMGIYAGLKSLFYKKFKSLFMFLAGATGVIIVCLILSYSNGLNTYINDLQYKTLSQYPITFDLSRDLYKLDSYVKAQNEKFSKDISELESKSAQRERAYKEARANDRVFLNNTIGSMFSTSGESTSESSSPILNDLRSLKQYFDKNPNNLNSYVQDIEYAYRTSPVIYTYNSNGPEEIFPANSMFGSLGSGSGKTSDTGKSKKQFVTSATSSSGGTMGPLPRTEEIYRDDECLVAGKWPTSTDELLLVLNEDGTLDDTMLYYLGMRDFQSEIAPLIEKYQRKEKVDFPGQLDSFSYTDFLDKKVKMINPSDCYVQEEGVWIDMSSDTTFMNTVLDKAKDLKVVGVVLPKSGSRTAIYLNPGLRFLYQLYAESIEQTKNSGVVQAQLNSPDIDVLSGVSFAYLEQSKGAVDRLGKKNLVHFNLEALLSSVKINPEALDFKTPNEKSKEMEITQEQMLKMIEQIISDPEFQEFIYDISKDGHFEEATFYACVYATNAYLDYKSSSLNPLSPQDWFTTPEGEAIVRETLDMYPDAITADLLEFLEKYGPKFIENFIYEFAEEIGEFLKDMSDMLIDQGGPSLIEFDEEKFSKSIGVNITADDISQLMLNLCGATEHTYKGNLADFGYDDLSDPVGLTIYPKDYDSKVEIINIIDEYNANMTKTNQEDKFVTYNDEAATTVDSVQITISLIAGVMIFFLLSTFVSSTLLIGVIFGLSTISRRREVGIMRALGARRKDITRMFSCESSLIGFMSGMTGVLISILLCSIINANFDGGFDICILPIGAAVVLVVVSVLLILLAGIVPAWLASRKDPVKAIRGL